MHIDRKVPCNAVATVAHDVGGAGGAAFNQRPLRACYDLIGAEVGTATKVVASLDFTNDVKLRHLSLFFFFLFFFFFFFDELVCVSDLVTAQECFSKAPVVCLRVCLLSFSFSSFVFFNVKKKKKRRVCYRIYKMRLCVLVCFFRLKKTKTIKKGTLFL